MFIIDTRVALSHYPFWAFHTAGFEYRELTLILGESWAEAFKKYGIKRSKNRQIRRITNKEGDLQLAWFKTRSGYIYSVARIETVHGVSNCFLRLNINQLAYPLRVA